MTLVRAARRLSLTLVLFALLPFAAVAATLEPLGMQDARLLGEGTGEFRIGFSYARDLHNQFQAEDRNRRLAEIPTLGINFGLGERVEGQLLYSYLHLQEKGESSKWGSGDLTVAFKVGLLREETARPALALRVATKFPNADEEDDFGTDETDVTAELLASHKFGVADVHLNLGLAILGDPRPNSKGQDDKVRYGIGLRLPLRPKSIDLLLSAEGLALGESFNQRGAVRGGLQFDLGRYLWDLGGSVGYCSRSEEWGVRTGLTSRFDFPAW